VNAKELRERLGSRKGFVWIKRGIKPKEQEEVFRLGLPGVGFLPENKRVYPNGPLAAHVLGFTNVEAVEDGEAALDRLHAAAYGLVIADWNMEPMTGYELLLKMRADANMRRTPFIMITAESKTENVVAAKQAGANNYIVKPFNAPTLKQKLASIFGEF
jgi:two-component system chemotaxis response regulator CheY